MIRAKDIARGLGGERIENGWMACCPVHDDKTPSLSISEGDDGRALVHCHAGCSQSDVIEALKVRELWPRGEGWGDVPQREQKKNDSFDGKRDRIAMALQIWDSAQLPGGTLVESYLSSRGITMPIPDSIRFHPRLKHRSGGSWPCMVALVQEGESGEEIAIHRTFLASDGSGKAHVNPQKMMLGSCRGGAVQLLPATEMLMVGEGIETCLSAMQATGYPAWAALSTSGLKSLTLPEYVRDVIILADGDKPGESAAQHAAQRWVREGRQVRIARPGDGLDFNDLLYGYPLSGDSA